MNSLIPQMRNPLARVPYPLTANKLPPHLNAVHDKQSVLRRRSILAASTSPSPRRGPAVEQAPKPTLSPACRMRRRPTSRWPRASEVQCTAARCNQSRPASLPPGVMLPRSLTPPVSLPSRELTVHSPCRKPTSAAPLGPSPPKSGRARGATAPCRRFTARSLWVIAALGMVTTLLGCGGSGPAAHRLKIPEQVLLEDFQRPMDRDLTEQLIAFEQTGFSKFIDGKVLKPFLDDVHTRHLAVTGVELTQDQFPGRPDLHQAVEDCARILGLPKPRVFITDQPGRNAYTMNLVKPVIVLSSTFVWAFRDPAELRFVIGHEMGHIKCRHVKWNAVLHAIVESVRQSRLIPDEPTLLPFLPLFKWAREAEMSADNAGLICAQDRQAAERALVRLGLMLEDESVGGINVDAFLRQGEAEELSKFSEVLAYWRHLLREHPFAPERIQELRKYEKTRQYQHLWE